jgi:hypothetical protein
MQTNDIPIWPDATVQFSSSELFKYRVPGPEATDQVVAFYQEETPKHGWITEHEPYLRTDQAVLGYKKGTRSITIIVEQMKPDQARVLVCVDSGTAPCLLSGA